MPPPTQHYEDAVLNGTALVLLDLPPHLRRAVLSLRKFFDDNYPDNGITHIIVNDAPVRSTSGDDVMESGVVFFGSQRATWALLDRVEVVLRTEDGPLELRRGYLPLGPQRILVEGVVTWGPERRAERPAPTPTPTPTPIATPPTTQRVAMPPVVQEPQQPSPQQQPQPQQPVRRNNQSPPQQQSHQEQPRRGSQDKRGDTVVITLHFKEVYSRHRNVRDDCQRGGRGDRVVTFPLTPFMVYQALAGECTPRKIVFINAANQSIERRSKVLVEVESEEVAAHVIKVFARRTLEFVSESGGTRPHGQRRGEERTRICAEVRYFVSAYYSTPNGQAPYLPNGQRNFHRTITVAQQEREAMSATDPKDAEALAVVAPREWQPDVHGNRQAHANAGGGDAGERAERSGAGSIASSPSASQQQQRQQLRHSRDDRYGQERRVSPPRSRGGPSGGGRRSRTPSLSRSYTSSRSRSPSSRSWSSSASSRSSSSSSSRTRHFRRRPRHEEVRRGSGSPQDRGHSERKGRDARVGPSVAYAPSSSLATGRAAERTTSAAAAAASSAQHAPRQREAVHATQVHKVQATGGSVAAVAAPPPPPPPAAHDSLPPHWRPIFSEEYQQTYYAYRDPETGVETTTWERPVA